jgi:hypothetical protein
MANKPNNRMFNIPRSTKTVANNTSTPLDIAARFFVYKLYEATDGRRMEQRLLRGMGETLETVLRSVELGWITLHGNGTKPLERSAAMTDEGRRLARRGR